MNRYTNAKLTDIHFIYGLSNGNGRVAVRLYEERYPTESLNTPFGCIRPWRNMEASEPRLTTRPSILKWTWWHEHPSLLLRSVKCPVIAKMPNSPCRVGVVLAYTPMVAISNSYCDALMSYF
ncbi:hypothetical protein TNCV_2360001 [Trichonephila clavipes]|nr:hypothetical protein TNCV_2360001 [Trichonephila clavipes]